MYLRLLGLTTFTLFFQLAFSQNSLENESGDSPERFTKNAEAVELGEFRAAWVTTVSNLDWPLPSERNNPAAQKASLRRYLDSLVAMNMNAALLQVRSECDALYDSPYEPWSRYLTGTQGVDIGYDPIAFAIEEAHKRGIELHAWMNPYRVNASTNTPPGYFASGHVYLEHPEWVLEYSNGGRILNPGLPEVQQYIKEVVGDLINKYDLDGVHFDDYFYAYGGTPTSMDGDTYATYGGDFATIGDFRRGSVNKMISEVWDTIQSVRPYIRFGVSPFGIYGNNMNPSGISGLDAYNTIYCDPLAWLEEQTVDYITPQLYWPTGGNQDYGTLLPWWAEWTNTYGRHLYAGLGIYRLDANAPARAKDGFEDLFELKAYFDDETTSKNARNAAPWTLGQINLQVEISRENAHNNSLGSVYFRIRDFDRVNGLRASLRANVYQNIALPPPMTWKGGTPPEPPVNLRLEQTPGTEFFSLAWDHDMDSIRYVIYSFPEEEAGGTVTMSKNRLGMTYLSSFNLSESNIEEGHQVVVTALDRYGYESVPSTIFIADLPDQVVLVGPGNTAEQVASNQKFIWEPAVFSSRYLLEWSENSDFTGAVNTFGTEETEVFLADLFIEGETTFFWRVAGENFSGKGPYSEIWSFTTGYPKEPIITAPFDGEQSVSIEPEFQWELSPASEELWIQVSQGGTGFSIGSLVLDETIMVNGNTTYQPDIILNTLTTHYVRVRALNVFGNSSWSEVNEFRTLFPTADPPNILNPVSGADDLELPVEITWSAVSGATSYFIQYSDTETFDNLLVNQQIYGATSYTINNLEDDRWYFARVASFNAGGTGEWSEVVTFRLPSPVLSLDKDKNQVSAYPNPHSGTILVNGLSRDQHYQIEVWDNMGRLMFEDEIFTSGVEPVSLDLKPLNSRMGILKIRNNETVQIFRLIQKN